MKGLCLLLLVLLGFAPQHAPELQLNLVAAPPPPPERPEEVGRVAEGCAGRIGDGPPTPFRVTLAETDRLAYEIGDAVIFTVIVENISRAPLVFGISRDPHAAPRSTCRVVSPGVHFNVALVALRKTGPGAMVAIASGYYGSPDVGGTTLMLQPGERVRVELPAEIRPGPGMEPVLTTDSQSVRIKAFVMMDGPSTESAYSDNSLAIELSERTRRH